MCDVCCEAFNLSSRRRVTCPWCPFNSCSACAEKYLLESPEDPHCMACRKGWARKTLCEVFSAKFVNSTLKKRREDLLFERERSLMPATQHLVEIEKRVRANRALIDECRRRVGEIQKEQATLMNITSAEMAVRSGLASELEGRIEKHRQFYELEKRVRALGCDVLFYEQCIAFLTRDGTSGPADRRQFVRACPSDGCNGFLSTAWKCGLCENWTCPECHEVKGPEKNADHACDPNSVATAQLLAKDSRPCPKCAAVIFKIDGCDQMFCTQCHTAFSWRRGTVETGRVHNPHYYEWLRNHGELPREPGDIPCGGLPDWRQLTLITRDVYIANIHRSWGHINYVVLNRYRTDAINDNRDLRIKYMIKDIDGDHFKTRLQQREKAAQKKTEIRQVLEMWQAVSLDLFQALMQTRDVESALEQFRNLRNHVNDELRSISFRFTKCAVPYIQDNFSIY